MWEQLLQFVEATSVLLFWLQAMRVIFAVIFGFRTGCMGLEIPFG